MTLRKKGLRLRIYVTKFDCKLTQTLTLVALTIPYDVQQYIFNFFDYWLLCST